MRVSGCNGYYELILRAGAKAKSVTNNLPILSVLAKVVLINDLAELVLGAVSIFYFIIRQKC